MGNPLQPGTYYIGVQDPNNVSSYTLQSRGIGLANYTIAVQSLAFNGSATNLALPVGEADYYQVVVPSNAPDWKLHLSAAAGDALLKVQRDYLPNSGGWWWWGWPYGAVYPGQGGQLMMKPGDEQWALLPYNDHPPGRPICCRGHIMCWWPARGRTWSTTARGTGAPVTRLSSWAEPATVLPDTLSYGNDLLLTNAQAGGEMKFYQFNVPAGMASIEVRLENRVGNPLMTLNYGTNSGGTRILSPILRQLWRNQFPMEQWQPDHDPQSAARRLQFVGLWGR